MNDKLNAVRRETMNELYEEDKKLFNTVLAVCKGKNLL